MLTEDVTWLRQTEGGILLFFNLCCLWEIIDHCQENLHQHVGRRKLVGLYLNPCWAAIWRCTKKKKNRFRDIMHSTFSRLCDTPAVVFENIVLLYGGGTGFVWLLFIFFYLMSCQFIEKCENISAEAIQQIQITKRPMVGMVQLIR